MKLIVWNARGVNNDDFLSHAWGLVCTHKPDVLILLETKFDAGRAVDLRKQLNFSENKVIPARGLRGGICVFWKSTLDSLYYTEDEHKFHSLFKFHNHQPEVLITVHAPSIPRQRHSFWNDLKSNLPPSSTPWLVVEDINEVTSQGEKRGGRAFRSSYCRDFNNFTDAAGLMDLGTVGNPYTWENARYGRRVIRERLDRAITNAAFVEVFPQVKVTTLVRKYSDHNPILISLCDDPVRGPFPFRCKEVWLQHDRFKYFFVSHWKATDQCQPLLIGRNKFLSSIPYWNTNVFGNLNMQKKILLARLNGIQLSLANRYSRFLVNLEYDLIHELNLIYKKERVIWAKKAGINWSKFGDFNTKYFHTLAKARKSRGKI
ncbi:uncharacterized protein LOC110689588 [Chenopodium quinoa]|uniref:uncharacterized protein LOC110689588 n=1 Tax=Chenopodium quinoa TaxID=63459 RepID=UPI000B795D4D|nr:uncharacterized protein LOC110689588 [Chenopodium quinoa]